MNIWYFCLDPRPSSSTETSAPSIHIMETVRALSEQGHQVQHFLYGDAVRPAERTMRQMSQNVSERNGLIRAVRPLLRDVYELYQDTQDIHLIDPIFQDSSIDLVYERLSQNKSTVSKCTRRYGIPLIVESNCPVEERKEYWGAPLLFATKRLEKQILTRAEAVVVVSSPLKRYYEQIGIDAGKIFVLPNGVNHERFSPDNLSVDVRAELGFGDKVVVGFVGNIFAYHGIELFLPLARACGKASNSVQFMIVGAGQGRRDLISALEQERLGHLFAFVDPIPNTQVPNYIAAMDICILPRFMWYGSPMKIFEYGAMGKAIVAPNQENIRDTLTHGQTAFLFEPADQSELIQAIQELIRGEQLRVRLGNAVRQHILANHTWSKNAERILNIYERVAL